MKKSTKITIVVILALLLLLVTARVLSGEDSWICSGGQWTKHGNPSAPMPADQCK